MNKLAWRFVVILAPLALALYWLYPTISWYSLPKEERDHRESQRDPYLGKILNLGLDLKGGTHLLLEVDTSKLPPEQQTLQGITDSINRAIEIIRNRIDQFGVAEPLIARQGDRWIVVQLPGIKDPERAKSLIGKTALLEFRLVDDSQAMGTVTALLRDRGISISSAAANMANLPQDIKAAFPPGYEFLPGREGRYYLLKSTPEMTGATLVNAKVELGGQGGFGYPEVSLEFNEEGARQFGAVTEANVNRNLAIVLDGIVQSAPTIRSRIPDGHAVIQGSFTTEEAKLLATVLRAGSLPAPVNIIEERTVGPTLGEDSIRSGIYSSLAGLLIVIIFMAVYYKMAGIVTDAALLLNLLFMLGAMVYFKATLTLPGIAGIILSLAMAVDANVLILERTREELLSGKTPRMALDMGYNKAFVTILDANITTLIAALFLFQFGTGPVKGFAVTLTIGLVISMFTAIFATRTYYIWRMQDKTITELSI